MAKTGKRQIAVKLSDDGYEGWVSYCELNGVSLSAYLDAMGQWLLDFQAGAEGVEPAGTRGMIRVVEHARTIDAERRRRKVR